MRVEEKPVVLIAEEDDLFIFAHRQIQTEKMELIAHDLTDTEQILLKLAPLTDVTHVFWLTWAAHMTYNSLKSYTMNRDMFLNALEALIRHAYCRAALVGS
ncbi:hypothetical protein SUGI_0065630 [Cryptomeria japonica]|nr:hypothetical protein SUGI_0065630 [Cryptomeria japonica]